MNIGFIGTGNMGTILIQSMIHSGAVDATQIIASNRTRQKAEKLREEYPNLHIAQSNAQTAKRSDIVFICVKPLEFKTVIDEIRPYTRQDQIIISITSPVYIQHLEDKLPAKIAKVIPSITNFVCSGAMLCIYGERLTHDDRCQLDRLFQSFSTPIHIHESFTRVTSDLSSCGPAFVTYFLKRFIDAAVKETGIAHETATKLASEMLLGTGKLLTSGKFTPESLIEHVSVPGGITTAGIEKMEEELGTMFHELIRATHEKYEKDVQNVEASFYEKSKEERFL